MEEISGAELGGFSFGALAWSWEVFQLQVLSLGFDYSPGLAVLLAVWVLKVLMSVLGGVSFCVDGMGVQFLCVWVLHDVGFCLFVFSRGADMGFCLEVA